MDLPTAESQYRKVCSRLAASSEKLSEILTRPVEEVELPLAEARYDETCGRLSFNSGSWATRQLRVDLIRQEYQNHLLRAASTDLLTARCSLKVRNFFCTGAGSTK